MLKVLIVDDEASARRLLNHYLAVEVPEVGEVKLAESADKALAILKTYSPDIVFLDVEMPEKNGFDFLMEIGTPRFDIVFTTAYNQYAIRAIRFSALDYLMKPINTEDLRDAVQRHLAKKGESLTPLYENLKENLKKQEEKDFQLAIPTTEGVFLFKTDEILWLEAERSYTVFHLQKGNPFVASKNLKYFEETLDNMGFLRPHKSSLVNRKHIARISPDYQYLVLNDGSEVEMSRRKKDEVLEQLGVR
ncbi:MAG: LytTR family DNA-binding domain-containing protein [Spirosomataceae bacterium]